MPLIALPCHIYDFKQCRVMNISATHSIAQGRKASSLSLTAWAILLCGGGMALMEVRRIRARFGEPRPRRTIPPRWWAPPLLARPPTHSATQAAAGTPTLASITTAHAGMTQRWARSSKPIRLGRSTISTSTPMSGWNRGMRPIRRGCAGLVAMRPARRVHSPLGMHHLATRADP
jgi:hypothetical protein